MYRKEGLNVLYITPPGQAVKSGLPMIYKEKEKPNVRTVFSLTPSMKKDILKELKRDPLRYRVHTRIEPSLSEFVRASILVALRLRDSDYNLFLSLRDQ